MLDGRKVNQVPPFFMAVGLSKVMNCNDFSILYSAQLDGYAEEHEQLALQIHLRECIVCRRQAAEMRSLRSDLRSLDASVKVPLMTAQIGEALRTESKLKAAQARRRADWIDVWTTRLFSQSIGAIVSVAMVLGIAIGVHNPAYRALALAQAATEVIFEDPSRDEIRLKVLLLQPAPPPLFNPSGDLLGFGASLSEDVEMMATVKVSKDGRATVNQVIVTPGDPTLMNRFSNVIKEQVSFVPRRQSRKTSDEAVVIFSKVNISG